MLKLQVLAEALGTFILLFCICGIIASMHLTGGKVGLLEYAITAALTVIVVVFSIGTISGAHVNPAVTIAFAVAGPFPWSNVLKLSIQLSLSSPSIFYIKKNWSIQYNSLGLSHRLMKELRVYCRYNCNTETSLIVVSRFRYIYWRK